ncbi:hypothetical protein P3W45_000225 [Vairimorpha bombi]|jgi:hypothetical protein
MKIQDLIECFMNEKNTNVFLRYRKDVIDYFYKKLVDQKINLDKFSTNKVITSLYELEIERVEYMIKEYLMTRVEKMKHDMNINTDLLSDNEKIFYRKLQNKMTYKICRDNEVDVVGFICKKDLGFVMLDGESVEMYQDDFFVGPMKDVYDLVNKGEIFLL